MNTYNDKIVLLAGNTNQINATFVSHFLECGVREIRILGGTETTIQTLRDELLTRRHADYNRFRFFVGDMNDNAYMEEALTGANFLLYLPVIPRPFDCDVAPAQTTVSFLETVAEVLHTATDCGVEKTVVVSPSRQEPLERMPDMLAALMEAVVVAEGRYLGKDAKTAIICIRHDGAFIDLVDYSFGNASNADLIVQNKVAFRCVPCESFDFSR